MTRARARKVNEALVQFMADSMEGEDLVKGKNSNLVFIIQAQCNGVTIGHDSHF